MIPRSSICTAYLFKHNTLNIYKIPVSKFHHVKLTKNFHGRNLRSVSKQNALRHLIARYESTSVYYNAPSSKTLDTVIDISEPSVKSEIQSTSDVLDKNITNVDVTNVDVVNLPDVEQVVESAVQLNALGEPTLSSLGLAKWTPPGLLQSLLENIHVTCGVPWWASITLTVVVVRSLMFPIVIKSQRHTIKVANLMPRLSELQNNLTDARKAGNTHEAMKATQELAMFVTGNNLNPGKNILYNMIQGPIFLCFFLALRGMCNLPVESMSTGGMYWFLDLTIPDQFYLLPLFTCVTLWGTIEMGIEKGALNMNAAIMPYINYGMKVIPFITFPFIMNFPAGLLVYWATNNVCSFVQVSFLKIPQVRNYFGIGVIQKNLDLSKKQGFIENMKQGYGNMKIIKEADERAHLDNLMFQRAGRTPVKTGNQLLSKPATVQAKKS